MKIQKYYLLDGAKQATGITVIIDVFRAFSVANYVFANGVEKIILVAEPETAFEYREQNPGNILIGERGGKIIPGFDFGNSPTEVENVDFSGKCVIHTTTNGIQGVIHAVQAMEIITGSFTNAEAICNYLKSKNPEKVSLVAMGFKNSEFRDEDSLCADYIESLLNNNPLDGKTITDRLINYESSQKFFDVDIDWAPERDFELCMAFNQFPFVLKAGPMIDNGIILKKVPV